jgi:hypothetical protein
MDVWELNPEEKGSLWFKVPVTWRGAILAEGLHDWETRAEPLVQLYPGIFLTTEETHGKPQSGNQLALDTTSQSLHRQGRLFMGSLDWPAVHLSSAAHG